MSRFIFEGDLQYTSKRQLDFISEVLEKKGFKGSNVTIEPVGKAGDNYIANVKRITVKEDGKTLKMVAKLATDNPTMREITSTKQIFQNEHIMYTEVFPKFDQKQKCAGLSEHEQFKFAKCYGSLDEAPNEIIILEDLRESNFNILDRFEPLANENVKLVLRNFAIYHALSFAIKYHEPEIYTSFTEKLAPRADSELLNSESVSFFESVENQALEIADDRCKPIIKGVFNHFSEIDTKLCKIAKESKYTVIQQGDAWTSNIMFKYENDVPVECILVDYQMVKLNSPVYDVMYMLFNSTTHKQRSHNFHEYIDYYHNELDKALHNFGLKANLIYPRDRLDADLKMYGKYMFGLGLIIANVLTKSTEEAVTMKELFDSTDTTDEHKMNKVVNSFVSKDKKTQHLLKIRVDDLADSFKELGLV